MQLNRIQQALTALFLLPTLALAQELHTFKNGEVADAEKINENFDLLMEQISAGAHPDGALAFRDTDSFVTSRSGVPEFQSNWGQTNALPVDGATWRVSEQSFREQTIVRGIPFNRVGYTRLYIDSLGSSELCPTGSAAFPWEGYYVYQNDLGVIAIATDWEFSGGQPHPDEMKNNPTGSYICAGSTEEDGRTTNWNLNMRVIGASGRYACATWHGGRLVSAGRGLATSTGGYTNFETTALGDYGERISFGTITTVSNGASPTGILSVDVPATCEESSRLNNSDSMKNQLLQTFGISSDLLPIQ